MPFARHVIHSIRTRIDDEGTLPESESTKFPRAGISFLINAFCLPVHSVCIDNKSVCQAIQFVAPNKTKR